MAVRKADRSKKPGILLDEAGLGCAANGASIVSVRMRWANRLYYVNGGNKNKLAASRRSNNKPVWPGALGARLTVATQSVNKGRQNIGPKSCQRPWCVKKVAIIAANSGRPREADVAGDEVATGR